MSWGRYFKGQTTLPGTFCFFPLYPCSRSLYFWFHREHGWCWKYRKTPLLTPMTLRLPLLWSIHRMVDRFLSSRIGLHLLYQVIVFLEACWCLSAKVTRIFVSVNSRKAYPWIGTTRITSVNLFCSLRFKAWEHTQAAMTLSLLF